MKQHLVFLLAAGAATLGLTSSVQGSKPWSPHHHPKEYDAPVVFQAAGPNIASIQSMVDQYRAALGAVNNGNNPGPLDSGRREINWDGGGSTATSPAPTPFPGFLNTRGALMSTPGSGFVQAPVEGLVDTFGNPSYATIFQAFSPVRLFSAVDSNVTKVEFFVPGTNGAVPATTTGFGAVFSDVDQPDGGPNKRGSDDASTVIKFYDVYGRVLHASAVPSSPGDASLSFLGVMFTDARIAKVRIFTGNAEPGADDSRRKDVVMMDDFIFGEPKGLE